MASDKTFWHGTLTSVQSRIRLARSFDERSKWVKSGRHRASVFDVVGSVDGL